MRSIPRVWEIGFQHVARRFGMGRRFKTKSPDEEASQSAAMYLGFLFISQFVQMSSDTRQDVASGPTILVCPLCARRVLSTCARPLRRTSSTITAPAAKATRWEATLTGRDVPT